MTKEFLLDYKTKSAEIVTAKKNKNKNKKKKQKINISVNLLSTTMCSVV